MQCLLNVTTKEFVVTAHMGLKSIEHYPCFCVFLLLYDWDQKRKTAQRNCLTVDLWVMKPFLCVASQAFHCAEPGSRHVNCLPLFMSLLTYEVYYHSDTAEGGTQTEVSDKITETLKVQLFAMLTMLEKKCCRSSKVSSRLVLLIISRSRWPRSVTTAPGWSRRSPSSKSARSSSAACGPWPLPTSWRWLQILQAATSFRPSSPHPVTREEARSLRGWRYVYNPQEIALITV